MYTHSIQVPQLHNQVTIEVHTSGPVFGVEKVYRKCTGTDLIRYVLV